MPANFRLSTNTWTSSRLSLMISELTIENLIIQLVGGRDMMDGDIIYNEQSHEGGDIKATNICRRWDMMDGHIILQMYKGTMVGKSN